MRSNDLMERLSSSHDMHAYTAASQPVMDFEDKLNLILLISAKPVHSGLFTT